MFSNPTPQTNNPPPPPRPPHTITVGGLLALCFFRSGRFMQNFYGSIFCWISELFLS